MSDFFDFFAVFGPFFARTHKSFVSTGQYLYGRGPGFRHSQPVLKKLVSLDSVASFFKTWFLLLLQALSVPTAYHGPRAGGRGTTWHPVQRQ